MKKHLVLLQPKPTEARAHCWARWEKTKTEGVFLLLKRRESKVWPPLKRGNRDETEKADSQNHSGTQTLFLSDFSSWEVLSLVSQPHLLQPGMLKTLFMPYLFTDVWLTSSGHCREAWHQRGQHISGLDGMALSKKGSSGATLMLWECRDGQLRQVPAKHPLGMLPLRIVPPARRGEGLVARHGDPSKETCPSPPRSPILGCMDGEQRGA